jgi:hypothetical protein
MTSTHLDVAGDGVVDARATPSSGRSAFLVTAVLLCAASMLAFGVWAYVAPHSFSEFIDYAPYNRHLVHDAGAFQIGLGVALVVALFASDGMVVALTGFSVASGMHTLSHYVDRHIGGHDSDVPTLGLFTLLALIALAVRVLGRKS